MSSFDQKTIEHTYQNWAKVYDWLTPTYLLGNEKRLRRETIESIHDDLRLYINFFQPSFKLIAKEQIGNKTIKRYDTAKTPYQRVLERQDISLEAKARLMNLYVQLNPAELRRTIDQKTVKLWKIPR